MTRISPQEVLLGDRINTHAAADYAPTWVTVDLIEDRGEYYVFSGTYAGVHRDTIVCDAAERVYRE